MRARLSPSEYASGVLAGSRTILARAITVIESDRPDDGPLAEQILDLVLPHTGNARRIGITGMPGAGKSTFIDALGTLITESGETLAVLSVDPSSPFSQGSILGDKTRMERLAQNRRAYIRPSPSRGHLGGIARHTRETILLCEAAGFSNIFVETVGVGQSETAVRSMTDFFLLLTLAGAGDELQGMKRGILEMVDLLAVNKADGENIPRAERARAELAAAMHYLAPSDDGWQIPVVTCSAITGKGLREIWDHVREHSKMLNESGRIQERRRRQNLSWMRELVRTGLEDEFARSNAVLLDLPHLQRDVLAGKTSPVRAARQLLGAFFPKQ